MGTPILHHLGLVTRLAAALSGTTGRVTKGALRVLDPTTATVVVYEKGEPLP